MTRRCCGRLLQLRCQLPSPPAPQPGTASSAPPITAEQLFILHTWQTYFSTVFKTGLTVTAQVSKANEDHCCFYLVLSSESQLFSKQRMGCRHLGPGACWGCGDRCGVGCYRRWNRVLEGQGSREEGNGGRGVTL